jgi:acetyltransferase
MVLVGEYSHAGASEIIAVGRLSKVHARDEGELAVLVDDRFQHLGVGTELYKRLIHIAHEERLTRLQCTVLTENREMQAICQKLGFRLSADPEDGTVRAELDL